MKFQKTLVAVAIAGIAAVPAIASADTVLSGAVQIQLTGSDADSIDAVEDVAATVDVDETVLASSPGDIRIAADDVLFGIATEHELNSGLTGYGSLRVDMNRLSNEGNGTVDPFDTPGNDEDDIDLGSSVGTADSVYVGIKGGFGDLRFGEVANGVEVGQVANDIYDVAGETSGGIGYTGSFGPVGLTFNFSPEQNQDVVGAGVSFGLGGFSIGVGAEDRAEVQSTAAGATFAFAGASIGAHFWTKDDAAETESVSVQVGYGFGGVSATLTASQQEGTGIDDSAIRLDLVYDLGGGMDISSRITAETDNEEGGEDLTSYRVKLSKSF